MANVTLFSLFSELDGRHFETRQQLESAVLEIFNRHLVDLPVGYSYEDAIEGARAFGWLVPATVPGHGVEVSVRSETAHVGTEPVAG
jgi:hypothetical protein